MWGALTKLYQSSNEKRKMVLREELRRTKTYETNTVASYLTKITKIKDELAKVGETIQSSQLVRSTLSGFPKKWDAFVDGIVAGGNIPSWERLWDDFMQEETRRHSKNASQHDEEKVRLKKVGDLF